MKKFMIVLLLTVVFNETYAHKEWVHQYIVQQAYNLLVDYYDFNLPEMAAHMGEYGPGEAGWRTGTILTGAWREDSEDVIGNSGSYSGNHFWEADISDDQQNYIFELGPQINAYQKVLKFANGDWNLAYQPPGTQVMYYYQYNSLVDLYTNGNLHQVGYTIIPTGEFFSTNIWIVASIELKNLFVWEILGRMCHLLADMSVPAHVHLDDHVCWLEFQLKLLILVNVIPAVLSKSWLESIIYKNVN